MLWDKFIQRGVLFDQSLSPFQASHSSFKRNGTKTNATAGSAHHLVTDPEYVCVLRHLFLERLVKAYRDHPVSAILKCFFDLCIP